jgi:LacI family transcriptional regulator, fructose operon transcriptional repressor
MVARCGYQPSHARDALQEYVAKKQRLPSGLFVNSITAFEGIAEFANGASTAPLGDCVVGCFDLDPFAAQLPFTSVMMRQDVETMMEEAFASLDAAKQAERGVIVVPLLIETNARFKDG